MTDLSPAAQAVRDAAEKQTDLDLRYAPQIAAAALRAAADQVVPSEYELVDGYLQYEKQNSIREAFLAIAAELEGNNG
jgi:hypothetical protein